MLLTDPHGDGLRQLMVFHVPVPIRHGGQHLIDGVIRPAASLIISQPQRVASIRKAKAHGGRDASQIHTPTAASATKFAIRANNFQNWPACRSIPDVPTRDSPVIPCQS